MNIFAGLGAFLASFVEFAEALTVVLAVGSVRGWGPALSGAACGASALALIVAFAGPSLAGLHLAWLRLPVGLLVLVFGLRWLRKFILRSSGRMKLRDEMAAYGRAQARAAATAAGPAWHWGGFALTAQVVLLEGGEVAFIVLAVAAGGAGLASAATGAAAALAIVLALGVMLHRPITRVPDNVLKGCVGVLMAAFGTIWIGDGLGLAWPGGDAMMAPVALAWGALTLGLIRLAQRRAESSRPPANQPLTGE